MNSNRRAEVGGDFECITDTFVYSFHLILFILVLLEIVSSLELAFLAPEISQASCK